VASATPDAGPAAAGDGTEAAGDDTEVAGDDAEGSARTPRDEDDRSRSRRDRRSRRQRKQASASEVTEDISAAEVQATFSAVSREYQQFKKSFGPRFEDAWADLAQRAQYAGTDAEKLLDLSQRLARFRARMRDARGE
jgi:hypothetical protein